MGASPSAAVLFLRGRSTWSHRKPPSLSCHKKPCCTTGPKEKHICPLGITVLRASRLDKYRANEQLLQVISTSYRGSRRQSVPFYILLPTAHATWLACHICRGPTHLPSILPSIQDSNAGISIVLVVHFMRFRVRGAEIRLSCVSVSHQQSSPSVSSTFPPSQPKCTKRQK